jgi:rhodanese-related sulfurtransferase
LFRSLRIDRITPIELKERMDAGEEVAIVDLRHAKEVAQDGSALPGAIRVESLDGETIPAAIPRDRDIVLYCS